MVNTTTNRNETLLKEYGRALRVFEESHRVWMGTAVHTPNYKAVTASKDEAFRNFKSAKTAYELAVNA